MFLFKIILLFIGIISFLVSNLVLETNDFEDNIILHIVFRILSFVSLTMIIFAIITLLK